MADPLSISVSILAAITAAIQSSKSLFATVKRFKDRNKTLRRLQDELEDLIDILNSLEKALDTETSMPALLRAPISRCSQVCLEFEQSMKVFTTKSTTGFLDWTKMEFRRGDMNEFIDTISGYKSTISVGLGTINMHKSNVSHKLLQEFNELIQDTAHNLKVHLQQIDGKTEQTTVGSTNSSDIDIDLKDERAVTKQCLRVCENAMSYIESVKHQQSRLLQEAPQDADDDVAGNHFDAQRLTRQVFDENGNNFTNITKHLRDRLEALLLNGDESDDERPRLQLDIDITKQCLEVCQVAKEVSNQKIYRIGEAVADGDSDQVVVTTLADLFDIKKVVSTGNSAQLVGSMDKESLRNLVDKRYASRFGSLVPSVGPGTVTSPQTIEVKETKHSFQPQAINDEQLPVLEVRSYKPSPNEIRKRQVDDNKRRESTSGSQ